MSVYIQNELNDYVVFEGIRGSHLYGLATATSDIDTHSIFISPKNWIYGIRRDYPTSIQFNNNNSCWYEIEKFISMLGQSRSNALELLYTPKNLIKIYNPVLDPLFESRDEFITKECFKSFGHYAISQIKKARGLNKLINIDPQEVKERKSPLHFCNVISGSKSIPLDKWLEIKKLKPEHCGVVRLPRGIELYALYYDWGADKEMGFWDYQKLRYGSLLPLHYLEWKKNRDSSFISYRGILDPNNPSTQLRLSSIEKKEKPLCNFQYNINAFTDHCNKYKRYWDWVKNRNEERYVLNKDCGYNSKNISQAVRLFNVSIEIADGKGLILDRGPIDRDLLLEIRNSKIPYDEIMKYVESLKEKMDNAFRCSKIPEAIDKVKLENLLIEIRENFYQMKETP